MSFLYSWTTCKSSWQMCETSFPGFETQLLSRLMKNSTLMNKWPIWRNRREGCEWSEISICRAALSLSWNFLLWKSSFWSSRNSIERSESNHQLKLTPLKKKSNTWKKSALPLSPGVKWCARTFAQKTLLFTIGSPYCERSTKRARRSIDIGKRNMVLLR